MTSEFKTQEEVANFWKHLVEVDILKQRTITLAKLPSCAYGFSIICNETQNEYIIKQITPGSVAENVKLHAGDYVIKINDTPLYGLQVPDILNKLRDSPHSLRMMVISKATYIEEKEKFINKIGEKENSSSTKATSDSGEGVKTKKGSKTLDRFCSRCLVKGGKSSKRKDKSEGSKLEISKCSSYVNYETTLKNLMNSNTHSPACIETTKPFPLIKSDNCTMTKTDSTPLQTVINQDLKISTINQATEECLYEQTSPSKMEDEEILLPSESMEESQVRIYSSSNMSSIEESTKESTEGMNVTIRTTHEHTMRMAHSKDLILTESDETTNSQEKNIDMTSSSETKEDLNHPDTEIHPYDSIDEVLTNLISTRKWGIDMEKCFRELAIKKVPRCLAKFHTGLTFAEKVAVFKSL